MEGSDRDQFEILHWKKLELINDSHEKTQSKVRLRDCIWGWTLPKIKQYCHPHDTNFRSFLTHSSILTGLRLMA